MEIVRERDNKMLRRKEYVIRVEHVRKPTPSRKEIRSEILAKLNAPNDRTVIKKIVQRFGRQDVLVKVHVYYTTEDMMDIEDKKTLRLNGFIEATA